MFNQYEDIMSVSDVAEVLFIGRNRTYELLNKGLIKGFRIGRIWKIPKEAVYPVTELFEITCFP